MMTTVAHSRRRYGGTARAPHQRHDKRYTNPVLKIAVCGAVHVAVDWGLGGFRLAPFLSLLPLGTQLDGVILDRHDDPIAAFVVELVGRGGIDEPARFRFHSLPNETFDVLQAMILSAR